MPPPPIRRKGKEPKETVIYPSSKRPAPPFKPLRPSKVPRTESQSSITASKPPAASKPAATARRAPSYKSTASRAKDIEENDSSKTLSSDHDIEDDDELADLGGKSTAAVQRRRPSNPPAQRAASPLLISSIEAPLAKANEEDDPLPSQSDSTPSIPQALLLRLLHESFTDKNTKIDKHAIQVLQKYMEIFVREAIARAKHGKLEAAVEGDESELGGTWLDLEDLERVAPGLLCDF